MPKDPNADGRIEAEGEFTLYESFWKRLEEILQGILSPLLGPAEKPASLEELISAVEEIKELMNDIRGLEWYDIRNYDLSDARSDERVDDLPGDGNLLIPLTLTGTVQVKFDSPTATSFELSEYEPLKLKFDVLYLSNAAQAGKTLKLLIGKGDWELKKKIIQPADIQAQLRTVVAGTTIPLGANGLYESPAFDALNYSRITLLALSDQASAANGVQVQQSVDGEDGHWDYSTDYTLAAGVPVAATIELVARYVRVRYTNGAIAQDSFRLAALTRII